MHCGTPGRTPPRRPAFVGRLIRYVCLLLLALSVWAGPASAYPCGPPPGATRTLAGHKADQKECEPPAPARRKRGNADPISFAFFIGIIVAVLLVPITMRKREDLPPQ